MLKTTRVFLIGVFLLACSNLAVGQQSAVALDKKIRAQVTELGAGAKVTVFMKDGTKIRGSISQILDDSFDVTIKKETQSSIISYRDVEKIKRRGWSNTAKIGLGVAVGAGVIVGVLLLMVSSSDGPTFSVGP